MANKYIDTTLLTGLNDGSSPANAWRDLRQVLTNTQAAGLYAAGDNIYIRTHDGTSDITYDLGNAVLAQAAIGTIALPVSWIADAGVMWAGNSGIFTIRNGADTAAWKITGVNIFKGTNRNFVHHAYATGHQRCLSCKTSTHFIDFVFRNDITALNYARTAIILGDGTSGIDTTDVLFERVFFDWQCSYSAYGYPVIALFDYALTVRFVDCEINFINIGGLQAFVAGVAGPLSGGTSGKTTGNTVIFKGGICTNTNPASVLMNSSTTTNIMYSDSWILEVTGTDIGKITPANIYQQAGVIHDGLGCSAHAQNLGGTSSMIKKNNRATVDWIPGKNYPTLTATLPDTARTPFALRVYVDLASKMKPAEITSTSKFHTGISAVRTASVEISIKDTIGISGAFDNPQKDEWWIDLMYVDAITGKYAFATSKVTGNLVPSIAAWIPIVGGKVVYAANNYSRYTLSIITPTAVAQDTMMEINVNSSKISIDLDDYYFIDPNPKVI